MKFDPKRAARVGAKMLRQKQETRLTKKYLQEDIRELDNIESDFNIDIKDNYISNSLDQLPLP